MMTTATLNQNILVFKTNISTKTEARKLQSVLNKKAILKWNVDLEDCDRVLRIVTTDFSSGEIISLARKKGVECVELE
jgi:hypothetical protein